LSHKLINNLVRCSKRVKDKIGNYFNSYLSGGGTPNIIGIQQQQLLFKIYKHGLIVLPPFPIMDSEGCIVVSGGTL